MNTEQKEQSKILAEFTGRCGKENKDLYWVNVGNLEWVTLEQMEYHTNWNWIIYVCIQCKIKLVNIPFEKNQMLFHLYDLMLRELKVYRLSRLLECAVDFINYYNEHGIK
jgi:hypothetical protein